MKILVLNCGSSSIKWRVYPSGEGGLVEGVTVAELLSTLDLSGIEAVGHRMVHGGLRFSAPTIIDDEVVKAVTELIPLAPLHNPVNLEGVQAARRLLPGIPQVAVFDTAFHRTIPPANATYAIPAEYGIVRYGFHGTSHAYVSRETTRLTGARNVITLHLGNGASACAVKDGKSFATSMGLSPLEGLVMGTRSGDIDPAIVFHLHRVAGMPLDDIDDMLNQRSGLRGLCGDHDMREVLRRDDPAAELALEVYCARIKFYVGAYIALLGGVDAITFTAGVGENAPQIRERALSGLDALGISIDDKANGPIISTGRVKVCVIPTDEEREIAHQVASVL